MSEKAVSVVTDQIWEFNYHVGQQFVGGHVRAKDERTALLVAQRFCELRGYRPTASVRPFILADESILTISAGPEPMPAIPSVAEAVLRQ